MCTGSNQITGEAQIKDYFVPMVAQKARAAIKVLVLFLGSWQLIRALHHLAVSPYRTREQCFGQPLWEPPSRDSWWANGWGCYGNGFFWHHHFAFVFMRGSHWRYVFQRLYNLYKCPCSSANKSCVRLWLVSVSALGFLPCMCVIKDYNLKVKSVCLISMFNIKFWVLVKHAVPCYFEVRKLIYHVPRDLIEILNESFFRINLFMLFSQIRFCASFVNLTVSEAALTNSVITWSKCQVNESVNLSCQTHEPKIWE